MIVKKILIILLLDSLFINAIVCQTLIKLIEDSYYSLDSVSYIENIILSYKEEMEKDCKEMDDVTLELHGFDYLKIDFIQRQKILDSIIQVKPFYNLTDWKEKRINWFTSNVKDNSPVHYVLNLRVDSCNQSGTHLCLLPDTSKLPFNLFYFGRNYKDGFYVYCEAGQYRWQDSRYRTFSRQLGANAPKVFRKIIKKEPEYLLYCSELEGMNTILYVMNGEIYVYRIIQMKKYKLDSYVMKFLLQNDR